MWMKIIKSGVAAEAVGGTGGEYGGCAGACPHEAGFFKLVWKWNGHFDMAYKTKLAWECELCLIL